MPGRPGGDPGGGPALVALPAPRLKRALLATVAVVLFLAASGVLARYFAAENVERDREAALVQAEARGDVPGMLALLPGCRANPACVATVRVDAASLRRPGAVAILSTQSSTDHSLGGSVGETRVAWKVPGRYPVVQCVRVRRSGSFVTGIAVALLRIGPRIGSTADCPG
jgi:hypothetical protein